MAHRDQSSLGDAATRSEMGEFASVAAEEANCHENIPAFSRVKPWRRW